MSGFLWEELEYSDDGSRLPTGYPYLLRATEDNKDADLCETFPELQIVKFGYPRDFPLKQGLLARVQSSLSSCLHAKQLRVILQP